MKPNLIFLLFVSLFPLSPSAQEVGKVQFFTFGYYTENDHYGEDLQLWEFADSIESSRPFLDKMIDEISNHFALNRTEEFKRIGKLNDLLMSPVYQAFEDSVKLSGIDWGDARYFPAIHERFEKFISTLIEVYETEINRDGLWISDLPLSIILNNKEKEALFKLMQIEDLYFLRKDLILNKCNMPDVSYGSYPIAWSSYFHFFTDSFPYGSLVFSVPEGAAVQAFMPDSVPADTGSAIYKSLHDTLAQNYLDYFQLDSAVKITFRTSNSNVQICSIHSNKEYFQYWFSVGFLDGKPLWFVPGRPAGILLIDDRRYWIIKVDVPEIGMGGYQFYLETDNLLELFFESYPFSI
jgi:hypothetical protein